MTSERKRKRQERRQRRKTEYQRWVEERLAQLQQREDARARRRPTVIEQHRRERGEPPEGQR
jgi:hypothetical protein